MENKMEIFKNEQFGEIRVVEIDNEPWFVGKDVAVALGYTDVTHTILDHVDEEDRVNSKTQGQNTPEFGQRGTWLINESGLYSLIMGSKLESAKAFKKWVTSEVLPSIRKHGGYIAGQESMSNEDLLCKALLFAQSKIEEKDAQLQEAHAKLEEAEPKVIFADAVATAETTILIGELAKLLKQNGVEIGQNRLFEWLRENGYLIKRGSSYNLPTQKAMELGLFEIKESVVPNPDNTVRITRTTKVTGYGQQYFCNLFLKFGVA